MEKKKDIRKRKLKKSEGKRRRRGAKARKRRPGSYQQDNTLWEYSEINHQLAFYTQLSPLVSCPLNANILQGSMALVFSHLQDLFEQCHPFPYFTDYSFFNSCMFSSGKDDSFELQI